MIVLGLTLQMASNILSAGKHTPLASKHLHYFFTVRYNNIERKEQSLKKCDTRGRRGDVWKEIYYIYYQGKSHCIFVNKTSGIRKQASEPKTENLAALMPFSYFFPDVSIDQVDGFKDKIFKRDDLYRILDPSVISKSECKSIVTDLKSKVLRALNDPSNANVQDIEFLFSEGEMAFEHRSLTIKHEPPFSDWLRDYVSKTLGNKFIVESQQHNLRDLGMGIKPEELNEYAASKADLVVRRVKEKVTSLDCCIVSVDVPSLKCLGMVAELKISDTSNIPVWECFRNMSAIAASLALEILTCGTLVDTVSVYGIVAVITDLQHARLIKLKLDFRSGECTFMRCRKEFDLDLLLNMVVSSL